MFVKKKDEINRRIIKNQYTEMNLFTITSVLQNKIPKRILESHEVSTIIPVRGKLSLIPENLATQYEIVPFDGDGITVALLTTNTFSEELKTIYTWLEQAWYKPDIYYTDKAGIELALTWYTQANAQEQANEQKMKEQKEAIGKNAIAQIMELYPKRSAMDPGEFLMQVIKFGFQAGASDLHMQVQEKDVILRLRIDGVLKTICMFDRNEYMAYVQKVKFLGWMKMNIDYLPQDGRLAFDVDLANGIHKKIDVRINTMPGMGLENVVLRYLDSNLSVATFEQIWFWWQSYDQLKKSLQHNDGMVLVTGPTWSWKTTTLYTMLQTLNDGTRKIITLEDPVEYTIQGIEQSQINYTKWYTFEEGLKAILRHDPDIILVWETRSAETAKTALNAALTWHLVFTTLHTNSALDALSRLLMMGVEAYLLAPALKMIIAQRLIRKVCPHCVSWRDVSDQEDSFLQKSLEKMNDIRPDLTITYEKKVPTVVWCDQCNSTWYVWRTAVIETLELTPEIREKIVDNLQNTAEIMQLMRNNGFLTMQEDGIIKMLAGQTTMEELRRVI